MIEDEKEDMIVITTKEEKIMEDILKDKTDGTKKNIQKCL